MKRFFTLFSALFIGMYTTTAAGSEELLPVRINTVLGQLEPGMSEAQMLIFVKESYPEATCQVGNWSGQSGILEFKLDARYSISVTAISTIHDHTNRRAHDDLSFYIYDWKLKRRIDISFHTWGNDSDSAQDGPDN